MGKLPIIVSDGASCRFGACGAYAFSFLPAFDAASEAMEGFGRRVATKDCLAEGCERWVAWMIVSLPAWGDDTLDFRFFRPSEVFGLLLFCLQKQL